MSDSRSFTFVRMMVLFVVLSVAGCATTDQYSMSDGAGDTSRYEKWGVKIVGIRLSAEGHMLDFRYRVIDAEKAAPLFNRKEKAYLVDEATGAKFLVPESPKVGALRTTREPKADRNYFIIFVNPGRYIKKGNKVSVVIGDFTAEHLVVE